MISTPTASLRVLTFLRGGHTFAIEVAQLCEIRKFNHLRPLALGIEALAGFVLLGERILPLFDPLGLAGLPAQPRPVPLTACVCGDPAQPAYALLADTVQGQREIAESQLRRAPSGGEFLSGVGEAAPGLTVTVLAGARLGQLLQGAPTAPFPRQHAA